MSASNGNLSTYVFAGELSRLRMILPTLPFCQNHPLPEEDGFGEFEVTTTFAGANRIESLKIGALVSKVLLQENELVVHYLARNPNR